jgi:hypothetical protein
VCFPAFPQSVSCVWEGLGAIDIDENPHGTLKSAGVHNRGEIYEES